MPSNFLSAVLAVLSALLYFGAGAMVLLQARRQSVPPTAGAASEGGLALAAVALHGWLLYRLMLTPAGVDLGLFNSASLVGLEIVVILLAAALRQPVMNLGMIIFPLAGVSALAAWASPTGELLMPNTSWRLSAHIAVSLSAYSLLSIAAAQALLLAVQDYRLRQHRPDRLIGILPPIEIMERLLFQMIGAGFALLSLGLFSGFLFVDNLFAQNLVEKTTLSIIAWWVFALLLWGRRRFGWRGRVATAWTLGGFGVLMLAYFGSKLVLQFVLNQHRLTA